MNQDESTPKVTPPEMLQRSCGHVMPFYPQGDDPFAEKRREKFLTRPCEACRAKQVAGHEAVQKAEGKRQRKAAKRGAVKHAAHKILDALLDLGEPFVLHIEQEGASP